MLAQDCTVRTITLRARIIENLARALEFSPLSKVCRIFIRLNWGLKENLFAMLSLSGKFWTS